MLLTALPELGRRLQRLGEGLARSGITSVVEVRKAAFDFIIGESTDVLESFKAIYRLLGLVL